MGNAFDKLRRHPKPAGVTLPCTGPQTAQAGLVPPQVVTTGVTLPPTGPGVQIRPPPRLARRVDASPKGDPAAHRARSRNAGEARRRAGRVSLTRPSAKVARTGVTLTRNRRKRSWTSAPSNGALSPRATGKRIFSSCR